MQLTGKMIQLMYCLKYERRGQTAISIVFTEKDMGLPSLQQIFQWFYLFLIRYMFWSFDHPGAGIHNREKP
jgi:hypothetical protein